MVCELYTISLSLLNSAPGNGTQSIVWQINEETYRVKLEEEHGAPLGKAGLQIFYGSLHDILSYPCEVRSELSRSHARLRLRSGWETEPSSSCLCVFAWTPRPMDRKYSPGPLYYGGRIPSGALREEVLWTAQEGP